VRRVTTWSGESSGEVVRLWSTRLHRQGTLAVAVVAVAVLAAGSTLAGLLGQKSSVGAVAIVVAGFIWILLCLDRGLLQAHRSYRPLAANLLVEGGVRTVAMLGFVAAGRGPMGAAVGVLIAELVTATHARLMADKVWASGTARARAGAAGAGGAGAAAARLGASWRSAVRRQPGRAGWAERRVEVLDLVFALVALAMVAVLQNIDVIVVGRDRPGLSGSYAAVSVSSKVLVFGAVVLGSYLLPEAAIRWHAGGHALRQLAVTLLLLAIPATILVVISLGAPHLLLSIVFRNRYRGAAPAFAPLVGAMVCLSVTVILTMYLLAVGRRWITPLLVVGAAATSAAVVSAHGVAVTTAERDLLVQGVLAAVTVAGFARVHHRRIRAG
jgi:O-antigen/teichoic acid export membrane protein